MWPQLLLLTACFGLWNTGSVYAQRKVCPRIEDRPAECPPPDPECTSDDQCRPGTKCCTDGCDLVCTTPVKPTGCTVPMDMALLIDSSGSISRKNWVKTKAFVRNVIGEFEVSEKGTHIGIIVYSSKALLHMKFNEFKGAYLNQVNYQKKADEMPHLKGLTFIDRALKMANTQLFTKANGMREKVKKVVLVVTDGQQTKDKGPFTQLTVASAGLKEKGVTVYSLGVGKNVDILELLSMATGEEEVFKADSFDELVHVVKNITAGQCKACTAPIDLIFGLPVSTRLSSSEFGIVKEFTKSAIDLFEVNNRQAHVSFIPYSDQAEQVIKLDAIYSKSELKQFVDRLQQTGSGYNVEEAITRAADNGFTIFGGTRPTAPKVMILLVPESTSPDPAVAAAAQKLKSQGVKLITVKIGSKVSGDTFKLAGSQPPSRYFFDAQNFNDVDSYIRDSIDTACKAKFGKCPVFTHNPSIECPDEPDNECELDSECGASGERTCCQQQCGFACAARIRNCMIPMDIGIVIDSSEAVTDSEFQDIKTFAKRLVYEIADAENNIHFGLMTYAGQPKTIVDFRQLLSQRELNSEIDKLTRETDPQRRIDLALRGAKKDLFSLEGGIRQGHPRHLIFLTSGESSSGSEPINVAAKDLDTLDVTRVAVGINRNVNVNHLRGLASENRFVFTANQASALVSKLGDMRRKLCGAKPGQCPPVRPNPGACEATVPSEYIPCGKNEGDVGSTDKEDDYPCPGEDRCCQSEDGCYQICRTPPNVCKGKMDLTIVLDASDATSTSGFQKVKTFARQLVDSFQVGANGAHVGVVSYGLAPSVDLRLNTYTEGALTKQKVSDQIDKLKFKGGRGSISGALEAAANDIFTEANGMRGHSVNKSLVIISDGRFDDSAAAIEASSNLKQKFVDIYAVPVGDNPDIDTLKKLVSREVENNVFVTSSYNALEPHLRSLTKTVCEGAAKLIEVVGPPGPNGAKGENGKEGPIGNRGPSGSPGEPGGPGGKGAPGFRGSIGRPGPPGPPGSIGSLTSVPGPKGPLIQPAIQNKPPSALVGPPGERGRPGSRGMEGPHGFPGSRGPSGDRGSPGPPGPMGPRGPQGRNGPDGEQGRPGRQGPVGDPGNKGPVGDSGTPGLNGPKGDPGWRGIKGSKGPRGETGDDGAQGKQGPLGRDGNKGPTGAPGRPGRIGTTGQGGPAGPGGPVGNPGSQGAPGAVGSPGAPGLSGTKGAQGSPGAAGNRGYTGETGDVGKPGSKGAAGANGQMGETGPTGQKGSAGSRGPAGAQGKQGEQGPAGGSGDKGGPGSQGESGDTGKTGERGMTGAKGKLGRSGQLGPQGAPGPRGRRGNVGATGPAGLPGPVGDRGAQGHQGLTGLTGSNGAKGNTGDTGSRGQQGNKGEAGAQGNTGAAGPVGDTGNRGKIGGGGKPGDNGSPGTAGEDGAPGEQGPTGPRGKSGPMGFAGSKGARGPVGRAGERGSAGPTGPKGEQGAAGASGLPGSTGQTGAGGPRGEPGSDGKIGAPGVSGPSGNPGDQGPIGERGPKGTAGRNGESGKRGPNGIDGEMGETGPPGGSGRQGEQGSPGAVGERGINGPQGDVGPLGPTGPLGAPGVEGKRGKPGPSGETGDQGRRGGQGPTGADGERGIDGENGPAGETGEKGPKGEQGDSGQPGPNGGRGPQGARGDPGPPGKDGYAGSMGAAGPVGGRGPRGPTGKKGVQGDEGVVGRQGEQGPMGAQGALGEKGGRGDYGPDGAAGAPGDTGPQGSNGPDGSAGNAGPAGPTGRQGAKGGPGDSGSPGARGEPGRPGLPGRDGTPGESGDGGVTGGAGARGTQGSTEPGGMRGGVGAPGQSGADGGAGAKGERGNAGQNGKKGAAGRRGKVGAAGVKGTRGEPGPDGYPGSVGPTGYAGRDGPKGATGSRGPDGAPGSVGPSGVAGPQGSKGMSGTEGATGAEGEQGSVGQTGKVGEQGSQGEIGDKGFTGDQGQKGDRGVNGVAGPPGAVGRKGATAYPGKQGPQGPKGPRGGVGEPGPAGGLGKKGPEGPAGGVGLAGPKGDRGPRGQDGARGPPGPPGPPGRTAGHGITELPSAGDMSTSTKNPNLYRSALGANEDVEVNRESDVLTALVSLSNQVHFYKSPIGTKKFPARTCRDLRLCYGPTLQNGEYWIDPNEGIPDDAVEVFCNFETNSTCIFPSNNATEKRKWFSGPDGYQWIGQDLKGLGQIRYVSDSTQMTFLRLLSDRAKQTITYHCKNSVAWYNEESQDYEHSIKLMGDNGIELHASSSNKFKPRIVRDDCRVKDGTWRRTVVEIDTHKTHRLPVNDVAVYDIGDKEEEFGLEIGPVCFS